LNNIIADIDDKLKTKFPNHLISSLGTNDVAIWNGTTWVRASGTPSSSTFLRGDGSWAAVSTTISVGTSLPGSPTNGQQYIYTDSTTAPTYQWLLQYDSSISGSYKWRFIGGFALMAFVDTEQSTTSTSYTDLTTTGPTVTSPLAGTYLVRQGCYAYRSTGSTNINAYMSYNVGGTGAVDADAARMVAHTGSNTSHATGTMERQKTVAASTAFTSKYKVDANGANFGSRFISILPVLVG
jgi:hypothetical protein